MSDAACVTSLQPKECTAGVCNYPRPISEQSVSTPVSLYRSSHSIYFLKLLDPTMAVPSSPPTTKIGENLAQILDQQSDPPGRESHSA